MKNNIPYVVDIYICKEKLYYITWLSSSYPQIKPYTIQNMFLNQTRLRKTSCQANIKLTSDHVVNVIIGKHVKRREEGMPHH